MATSCTRPSVYLVAEGVIAVAAVAVVAVAVVAAVAAVAVVVVSEPVRSSQPGRIQRAHANMMRYMTGTPEVSFGRGIFLQLMDFISIQDFD